MTFQAPNNVTANVLYDALTRFGVDQAAQMGYFNNLVVSGSDTNDNPAFLASVKAPVDTGSLPPTYGDTVINLAKYSLHEAFVITGTVMNGIAGVLYDVSFRDVTSTSATVHVASYNSAGGEVPSLDVKVAVRIFV
ncbi:hypothetical protein OX90_11465 [Pseudomonas coronafaciens pv. porri]|uniref:Uncharacterized protein n=1 Tax=Pseudomonas coronafaciens pv. porri TaxID=83964 RepID=A0ABR5JPJ1_9PSED|nr:hypothetical protein [Pseudomonas coronafaciens]KOP51117.1 hypothetical protein OX88_26310 [Pseudomonas coronafaciens pv. porri]KOP59429.1 hypothetical protein OX90_11465 [Pseudomonas coronafaciens pv. porri]